MIPNYASEQFYYSLSNTDRNLDVHALRYSHQVSTGKGTSQVTDFSGFMIKTQIAAESNLYIRKWDLSEKIRSTFNVLKPDRIEDGVGINGTFDQPLKQLRDSLLALGFKDVVFIEQEGFTTVLCEDFKIMPKVTKKEDENKERHKAHVLRLCQVTSLISSL